MSTTKERPIIFSGPMIRAILENRKSQTRRVMKPQPTLGVDWLEVGGDTDWPCRVLADGTHAALHCPYGAPGDRLWVQEAWQTLRSLDQVSPSKLVAGTPILYAADRWNAGFPAGFDKGKMRPSIFLPRWARRIMLNVKAVRL